MKKVVVSAGGTGGHVYPAMSVAKKLKEKGIEVHFAGGKLSSNPYFEKELFPFTDIACGALHKRGIRILKEGFNLCKGIAEGIKFLRSLKPDLIVGFGSYHTFPVLCAARIAGYPYILHEANVFPGKVIRAFSSKALFTGIHFPGAASWIKGKTKDVLLPPRTGYVHGIYSKEEACHCLGLNPDLLTFLLFGGSQGAEILNKTLIKSLPMLNKEKIQFIHITGNHTVVDEVAVQYKQNGFTAYVVPFENRMNLVWSAVDLAITRSGANTISESIEFEVPLIVVPYPHAADQHQDKNADFLVNQVGSGIKILQKELNPDKLCQQLMTLIEDRQIFKMWKEKIKQYKQNVSSTQLDLEILKYLGMI